MIWTTICLILDPLPLTYQKKKKKPKERKIKENKFFTAWEKEPGHQRLILAIYGSFNLIYIFQFSRLDIVYS